MTVLLTLEEFLHLEPILDIDSGHSNYKKKFVFGQTDKISYIKACNKVSTISGGWMNPLISDWFADYARVVYTLFGNRVKTFLTVNEPMIFCDLAYNTGVMAPGYIEPDVAPYICNKHALLAHAKAYRIYDKEFRGKYHGEFER